MSFLRLIAAEWRLIMAPSSKRFVLLLLVFALLLPLSSVFLKDKEPANLIQADMSLVTEEKHPLVDYTVTELNKNSLVGKVYVDDLATAEARMKNGDIVTYVKFPPDFFATLGNVSKREQVHIVLNPRLQTESEIMAKFFDAVNKSIIRSSASYYAYHDLAKPFFLSPALLSAHFTQKTMQMVSRIFMGTEIDTHTEHPRFNMEAHVLASFFVILTMFSSFLPLIFTIRDEQNGLKARFLSLGLWQSELLAARLLCGLPFLFLSEIPVCVLAIMAFGFSLKLNILLLLLFLYLGSAALLLAVHSLWPKLDSGSLYLSYWLIFAQLLVGGVIYPNDLLPDFVKALATIFVCSPAHFFLFMNFAGFPSGFALWHLAALAIMALALLSAAENRRSRRNLI